MTDQCNVDCSGIKVVIACGGTGGHFYPTLSIAEAITNAGGTPVLFVSGQHADEQMKIAREAALEAEPLPAVRLPSNVKRALTFPFALLSAVWTARKKLRAHRPDCVLGMGSFAAAPTGLAAVLMGIPLALHEGNSWMGRANRWLARWARSIAVSLPLHPDCRPDCPVVRTGMPLRQALLDAAAGPRDSAATRKSYGLDPETGTLLVFGGSQGAQPINALFAESASRISALDPPLQVLHFTGTEENEALVSAYADAGIQAVVMRGDPNIQNAYIAADLVICRGGASTLSELMLFGKPAVSIPFPAAIDDHQTVNTTMMAEAGAVRLLRETDATVDSLVALLQDWRQAPETFNEMGTCAASLATPDAAEAVARMLRDLTKGNG